MGALLSVIFGIVVAISYYFGNKLKIKRKHVNSLLSFSAGVSITYVLLELFPRFTALAYLINRYLFVTVLIGFIIHHLIEKEIYQHNHRNELVKTLTIEEHVFSFIYHVILGILLAFITFEDIFGGFLFLIPILTFSFVKDLPAKPLPPGIKRIFLASSTLFGIIIGLIWKSIPLWIISVLMGTVTGILLFTIIRHHIPFGRKGRIGYFSLGFLVYSTIILISWAL